MPYKLVLKSSENWQKKSGDTNKLNTDLLFETENEYGFPEVSSSSGFSASELIPFNLCKHRIKRDKSKAVHFFIDDYKFEQIWTCPKRYIDLFLWYGSIISPTFSVWSNQPYALNLFNMYRSRYITRYYQSFGVNVLVDVRWSDESSYDMCFSGIEKGSPVIVNTVGTKLLRNRKMFNAGFPKMLEAIEPSKLYVYGERKPLTFEDYVGEVEYFESYWSIRRKHLC